MAPFNYGFNYSFGGKSPDPSQFPQYPYQFDSQVELGQPDEQNPYQMQQPQVPNFADAYRELMSRPKGKAMQAYEDFLSKGYPQETKPTKTTRIGAILSGAAQAFSRNPGAAYDTARSIIHEPYDREVKRYQLEGNRLASAAALEEKGDDRNLSVIRTFGELENKRIDNERAQRQFEETVRANNARIKQAEENAKRSGMRIIHGDDGHSYAVDIMGTGERHDLGKPYLSKEEQAALDVKKAKNTAEATDPIIRGRQAALANIQFGNAKKLAEFNQGEVTKRSKQRSADISARDAARIGAKGQSELEKLRRNRSVVEAIVDTDPARYSKVWGNNSDGYGDLIQTPPEVGTPEYEDYVELYNALHKGVILPNGSPAQLNPKPKTTPGGNTRLR